MKLYQKILQGLVYALLITQAGYSLLIAAKKEDGGFVAKEFTTARGEKIPYRLFTPKSYDPSKKYPVVLWLHGSEGRGDDNSKQISGGNIKGAQGWAEPRCQNSHPCFVIAPQMPAGGFWATHEGAPPKDVKNLMVVEPTENLLRVVELMKAILEEYSIDKDRVYVTGQSMGGFGTWAIITAEPNMFAAAIPVCGGGDPAKAGSIKHIAIWAFHGSKDSLVPVERSRNMIKALKEVGVNPKYTEYSNMDHGIWEKAYAESSLVSWLFNQKRQQTPSS